MERRVEERIRLAQEVLLCCPGFGLVKGITRDISNSGTYVATNHMALAENDRVEVCFISSSVENKLHKISAEVARVNKGGYGLRFIKTITEDVYKSHH